MISNGMDMQLAAKQAADARNVAHFKQQMDGLKQQLNGGGVDKEKKLRSACQNFEAVFISKLWNQMKSTVPKEGYLHSKQEEQYMSMFDREFAENMARAGGIGLADMIYEQLSQKLKETSRDTLSGGVQLKPLQPEPIALNRGGTPMALSADKKEMTLEDWGGDAAASESGQEVVSSDTIVSELGYSKSAPASGGKLMNDIEVKAELEALARRLEADRIKSRLLATGTEKSNG